MNALIDLAADAKPPSGKRLFGGLNPINCSGAFMRITLEMILQESQTCDGDLLSSRFVQDSEEDDEVVIGLAIATVMRGTQTARKIVALAHAIFYLSDGLDERSVHESEREIMAAAQRLIQYWKDRDDELEELINKVT